MREAEKKCEKKERMRGRQREKKRNRGKDSRGKDDKRKKWENKNDDIPCPPVAAVCGNVCGGWASVGIKHKKYPAAMPKRAKVPEAENAAPGGEGRKCHFGLEEMNRGGRKLLEKARKLDDEMR